MDKEDYLRGLRAEQDNSKRAGRADHAREVQAEIDRVTGKRGIERARGGANTERR